MKKSLSFGLLEMEREGNYGFAFNGGFSGKRTKMPKDDIYEVMRGKKLNKRRKKSCN